MNRLEHGSWLRIQRHFIKTYGRTQYGQLLQRLAEEPLSGQLQTDLGIENQEIVWMFFQVCQQFFAPQLQSESEVDLITMLKD